VSAHHAGALVELGRYAEAQALLTDQLAATPDDAHLLGLLARCQLGTGHHAAALATANRCVALHPEDEWGHRLASIALDGMGRAEEALGAAQQAVRLAPLAWRTHLQVALVAVDVRGRLVDARDAAAHAVRLAPNEPDAYFAVGLVAQRRSEHDAARAAYRHTLALDPQHAMALNNLTVLDGGLGLVKQARGFAEALRHEPDEILVQRNVEALAASFARRLYFAGLAALVVGLLVSRAAGGTTTATAVVGALLLVGCVSYTVHLGRRVPLGVRRFVLIRMCEDPFLIANCLLTGAMLTLALVTCLVPGGDTTVLAWLRLVGLANVALVVWTVARRSA